ncbi:MAG: hypothetical protein C5B54_04175 [Acidobacteria bacterium]|nr:MAG: hypothetical protein C5B54_04175 [Acidobacteriota bacterium]
MITIQCKDYNSLRNATLENGFAQIERIDDCRCCVRIRTRAEGAEIVKAEIAVGDLRGLADLVNVAAEFLDIKPRFYEVVDFDAVEINPPPRSK